MPGCTEILVIDDDTETCRLLSHEFTAPNITVHSANTATEAKLVLERATISLIILDLVLPDADGRTLLAKLRENPQTAMIPVIVLSAVATAATKTECFALGADDFQEKPFDPVVLAAAVTAKLERTSLLIRHSRRDALTNLPDRASFSEFFMSTVSLCRRQGRPVCLAILDLDHFKSVNDMHGHVTGDIVLQEMGAILSTALRKYDIVARWGGEEFVILLPDTSLADATTALKKLIDRVAEKEFTTQDGQSFHITLSAGIASVTDDMTVTTAIAHSDLYLYRAKKAGRNRIMSELNGRSAERRTVLLAEDDDLIAGLIMNILTAEGLDCRRFTSGDELLARAPASGVALVILNVGMPGMNGFDVLEQLRQRTAYRRTPVVMLSAMGSEEAIVTGFERGADDYVLKPFSKNAFMARLHRLLARA